MPNPPIAAGDTVPAFTRHTGFETWNRYAAVNDEFVPIHMDDEAGRAAGYPTAFGMGNLQWAYLHDLLRGWIGDDGRIETRVFDRATIVTGAVVEGPAVVEQYDSCTLVPPRWHATVDALRCLVLERT